MSGCWNESQIKPAFSHYVALISLHLIFQGLNSDVQVSDRKTKQMLYKNASRFHVASSFTIAEPLKN